MQRSLNSLLITPVQGVIWELTARPAMNVPHPSIRRHLRSDGSVIGELDPNLIEPVEKGWSGFTLLARFGLAVKQSPGPRRYVPTKFALTNFEYLLNKPGTDPNILMQISAEGEVPFHEMSFGVAEFSFMPRIESSVTLIDGQVLYTNASDRGSFSIFGLLCRPHIYQHCNMKLPALKISELLFQSPNFDLNGIAWQPLNVVHREGLLDPEPETVFESILMNVIYAAKNHHNQINIRYSLLDENEPSSLAIALNMLAKFAATHVARSNIYDEYQANERTRMAILSTTLKRHKQSNFARVDTLFTEKLLADHFARVSVPLPGQEGNTVAPPKPVILDDSNIGTSLFLIERHDLLKVNRFVKMIVPEKYHTHRAFEMDAERLNRAQQWYVEHIPSSTYVDHDLHI